MTAVKPDEAGRRLIFLSVPFLAFGLLLALQPPATDALGSEVTGVVQALGVALVVLAVGAIGMGVWLIGREDERIL